MPLLTNRPAGVKLSNMPLPKTARLLSLSALLLLPAAVKAGVDEIQAASRSALAGLDGAMASGDSVLVGKSIKHLRSVIRASRAQTAKFGDKEKGEVSCLRTAEMQAWELSSAFEKKDSAEVARKREILGEVYGTCRWNPLPLKSIEEAESAADRAELLIKTYTEKLGPQGPCGKTATVEDLAGAISRGEYSWTETDGIRQRAGYDVVRYYQFRGLAAGTSADCDAFTPIEPLFVNDSMKSTRSNGMSCRGWVDEQLFARAMLSGASDLRERCRSYVGAAYPYVPVDDADAICRTVAEKKADPQGLCAELVAGSFLNSEKLGSCVDDFARYQAPDEKACESLNPHSWWAWRCRNYSAYSKAKAQADPAACGDDDVCRALTGPQGAKASAGAYAKKVTGAACLELKSQ